MTQPALAVLRAELLRVQQPQLEQLQLKDEIRDRVQEEVDLAFRQTTALLNVFLVILTLFPAAAAVGVWVLLGKLAKQTTLAQQEIESLRDDTLFQLKNVLEEAEAIFYALKQQSAIAEEQTELLQAGTQNQPFEQMNQSVNHEPILTALDYARQGDALFFQNSFEEAVASYDLALQLQPDLADTWNNRGVVLTRLQRYSEAIASYERATEIRPEYADAWNNRGVVLLEMQQYQDAITSYDKAIQARPDYADAWNNRGVAFAKTQQYEEAVFCYNQALAIKNEYLDAWNNRGIALTKLEKYDAAIDSYDHAAKMRPDSYRVWYNKARCYALQSKVELAIENLKRAIHLNPQLTVEFTKNEPDFDKIRQHELFKQLIAS
ncbi:MAG: tetratricopeptide repeat protein [Actinomycetota bacterium]